MTATDAPLTAELETPSHNSNWREEQLAIDLARFINDANPDCAGLVDSLATFVDQIRSDKINIFVCAARFVQKGSLLESYAADSLVRVVESLPSEEARAIAYLDALKCCQENVSKMNRVSMEGILRYGDALPTVEQKIYLFSIAASWSTHIDDPLAARAAGRLFVHIEGLPEVEDRRKRYLFIAKNCRDGNGLRAAILRRLASLASDPDRPQNPYRNNSPPEYRS